jgi:hypothetical protein
MTVAATSPLSSMVEQLRTPVGRVLVGTSLLGVFMGVHWFPMALVMLGFVVVTTVSPALGHHGSTWMFIAGIWTTAVVIRRSEMEDHVYLYVAWLIAISVSLLTPSRFIDEVAQHGRYLIAVVFGFATFWKLVSGSFLTGTSLWATALLDSRMRPLMQLIGISPESLDAARPDVTAVGRGDSASYAIDVSSGSSIGLVAVAIGTVVLEAAIAITHAVPDANRLARWRAPLVIGFGIVTYAVVPVLPFALLLALIGATIARFDRRVMIGFAVMIAVVLVRAATL